MTEQERKKVSEEHPTGYKGIYFSHDWDEIKTSYSFIISIILAVTLLLVSLTLSKLDSYEILKIWAEMTISIFPNLLGFNLGGYALIIGFGNVELIEAFTEKAVDKKSTIFQRLSSIFSFAILLQLFAFILSYLITFIIKLDLPVFNNCFPDVINSILILLLSGVGLFGLFILPNLVVNLFNFGQAHHSYLTIKRIKNRGNPPS